MRSNDVFPSKYWSAGDLNRGPLVLTISTVRMERLGDDNKPVVSFSNAEKDLALNKTNWNAIAELYGDESDNWANRQIELFPTTAEYQGRRVAAVRVRAPQQAGGNGNGGHQGAPNGHAQAPTQGSGYGHQGQAPPPQTQGQNQTYGDGTPAHSDDDIPF